jgi:hypothetical protein
MKLKDLFEKWGLQKLKVKTPVLELEWAPNDPDKDAAWELYVELLTRITTQRLPEGHGDEKTALDSVFSLFKTTRAVLKRNGRACVQFTRIPVIVLNQIVRPFTAKWHKYAGDIGFLGWLHILAGIALGALATLALFFGMVSVAAD